MMIIGMISRTSMGFSAFLRWLTHPQLIDDCRLHGPDEDEDAQYHLRQPQLETMLMALIWNFLAYNSFDGWSLVAQTLKSEALSVRQWLSSGTKYAFRLRSHSVGCAGDLLGATPITGRRRYKSSPFPLFDFFLPSSLHLNTIIL